MSQKLSVSEFVARWQTVSLSERSASQSHFSDLCDTLGVPKPVEVDQEGNTYTFEKGVTKTFGDHGFADVWMRGYFAWEYKGKHKDLDEAYAQLLQYREDLENPPLLVVCDLDRFEIHTNYTNTLKQVFKFNLADLVPNQQTATCKIPPLEVLRAVFTDPERLKPGLTTAEVTEEAAAQFSKLAESLRARGVPSERAAHFLMRLLFCLFSEDIGLLPDGLFSRLIESNRDRPDEFIYKLRQLFIAMAGEHGSFGEHNIQYFDGGLFSDDEAYELTRDDLKVLSRAAKLNWASIEPAIFGTLFERSLDPDKRSQLGAHYTGEQDIRLIVEPVVVEPLRKRWTEVRNKAAEIIDKAKDQQKAGQTRSHKSLNDLLQGFAAELASVRVLDPACGSGNFLYVALKRILDLEKEVSVFSANSGLSGLLPRTNPAQLFGIESNVYAHELASVVVWIGYIQWQRDNGFIIGSHPILRPLQNIRHMDSVLAYDELGVAIEPDWPEVEVIIGNPPFLGGKKLRTELGDKYVDDLFTLYKGRVPHEADFVCYWFEKARQQITNRQVKRVGLLATQGIRGGANRTVLGRIKESGDIFWAQSDREWILEGANVRVSMIGFDDGKEKDKFLDGIRVPQINADLTTALNVTTVKALPENKGISFMGDTKGGAFDISDSVAGEMLRAPLNPNGRPNSDVVRRWANGFDVTRRPRNMWIIDFGAQMQESEASLYEAPFEYIKKMVKPVREGNRRESYSKLWWIHAEPRPAMRKALKGLRRFIATVAVAKHRLFVWMPSAVLPDHALFIFARDDDYFFGVLHSRVHEQWALWLGTALEDRPRYTSTTTFEPFPMPWPPKSEPRNDPRVDAIAAAARELVVKRDAWLNPADASPEDLKNRTLTNLYNENPTWLQDRHRELDEAVFAAYGWPKELTDQEIVTRLLQLNAERSAMQENPLIAR